MNGVSIELVLDLVVLTSNKEVLLKTAAVVMILPEAPGMFLL